LALLLCEAGARVLEPAAREEGRLDPVADPDLGWLPPRGRAARITHEFTAVYDVNALAMNDPAFTGVAGVPRRVLALGDSHTFAIGVSRDEAWPRVLEGLLFPQGGAGGRVYNGGVIGYSVGQYLLRWRRLAPVLRPQMLVIGLSMATDLYDIVPPSHGGFIYYPELGRIYFDLDAGGRLVERRELAGRAPSARGGSRAMWARALLQEHSALYRRLRSSSVALRLASAWHPGGESLWPGPDTAMKRDLSAEEQYRWTLVAAVLERLRDEAHASGCDVVVVLIPYLPQVYDDVWAESFGRHPDVYDRWVAGERVHALCRRARLGFVDTTRRFIEESRWRGHRLHFADDRHPTAEGQRLIAEEVARYLRGRGWH
jgi:lysophospholipase L1-like esterase